MLLLQIEMYTWMDGVREKKEEVRSRVWWSCLVTKEFGFGGCVGMKSNAFKVCNKVLYLLTVNPFFFIFLIFVFGFGHRYGNMLDDWKKSLKTFMVVRYVYLSQKN